MSNLIWSYRISAVIKQLVIRHPVVRQFLFLQKQFQNLESRSLGLFGKGKTCIIAKFHRKSYWREEKPLL